MRMNEICLPRTLAEEIFGLSVRTERTPKERVREDTVPITSCDTLSRESQVA